MRLKVFPVLSLIVLALFATGLKGGAQNTPSNSERSTSQQWLSHQMFQPPPRDSDKQKNSEKVVEEIKRLYMDAEKEIEAKNPPKTKQQKP